MKLNKQQEDYSDVTNAVNRLMYVIDWLVTIIIFTIKLWPLRQVDSVTWKGTIQSFLVVE
jgi:hypothetical protein